eukprot:403366490
MGCSSGKNLQISNNLAFSNGEIVYENGNYFLQQLTNDAKNTHDQKLNKNNTNHKKKRHTKAALNQSSMLKADHENNDDEEEIDIDNQLKNNNESRKQSDQSNDLNVQNDRINQNNIGNSQNTSNPYTQTNYNNDYSQDLRDNSLINNSQLQRRPQDEDSLLQTPDHQISGIKEFQLNGEPEQQVNHDRTKQEEQISQEAIQKQQFDQIQASNKISAKVKHSKNQLLNLEKSSSQVQSWQSQQHQKESALENKQEALIANTMHKMEFSDNQQPLSHADNHSKANDIVSKRVLEQEQSIHNAVFSQESIKSQVRKKTTKQKIAELQNNDGNNQLDFNDTDSVSSDSDKSSQHLILQKQDQHKENNSYNQIMKEYKEITQKDHSI